MIDYDLHIHTTASDGVLSPEEVFQIAAETNLKGISITDHDTVEALGQCEELGRLYNIDFIPGIELSTEFKELEIHMLGYYLDFRNRELLELLSVFREERLNRALKMIKKVNSLGYDIDIDEIVDNTNDKNSIGRPHLARALIKKGYFKNMNEVFDKLLGNGKPGFVERFKYDSIDAIKSICKFGGVPILAHPGLIKLEPSKLDLLIEEFVKNGLQGLEVYHTDHTIETSYILTKIANKHKLLVTGGSDYHAPSSNRILAIGSKGVTVVDIERLKMIAQSK